MGSCVSIYRNSSSAKDDKLVIPPSPIKEIPTNGDRPIILNNVVSVKSQWSPSLSTPRVYGMLLLLCKKHSFLWKKKKLYLIIWCKKSDGCFLFFKFSYYIWWFITLYNIFSVSFCFDILSDVWSIMKWDVGSLWITFFIFYMFEEIIIFFFLFFINCFLYSTITFVSLSHTVFDTLPWWFH